MHCYIILLIATETVESQWAMNGNPVWEFSVQQIASCTTTCSGCGGGLTEDAYAYIMSNAEGLGSQYWGPYVQSMTVDCQGTSCTEPCSSLVMSELKTSSSLTGPYAMIKSWSYATPACTGTCNNQNTTQLAAAVATNGPSSICVDASSWNDYSGGVLSQAGCGAYSSLSIDHCVQLTGYNAGATNPYWLVRNSWATNWGENGYAIIIITTTTIIITATIIIITATIIIITATIIIITATIIIQVYPIAVSSQHVRSCQRCYSGSARQRPVQFHQNVIKERKLLRDFW